MTPEDTSCLRTVRDLLLDRCWGLECYPESRTLEATNAIPRGATR